MSEQTNELRSFIAEAATHAPRGAAGIIGRLAEAADRIEELEADGERLDWMEAHPLPAEVVGGRDDGLVARAWSIACVYNFSLREALDIARGHSAPIDFIREAKLREQT